MAWLLHPTLPSRSPQGTGHPGGCSSSPRVFPAPQGAPGTPRGCSRSPQVLLAHEGDASQPLLQDVPIPQWDFSSPQDVPGVLRGCSGPYKAMLSPPRGCSQPPMGMLRPSKGTFRSRRVVPAPRGLLSQPRCVSHVCCPGAVTAGLWQPVGLPWPSQPPGIAQA